jgi:nucleoside triphosphatase
MEKQFPKIVVGCFILNDKQEILLARSRKWLGKWIVVGGHIEWGETIASTVEREAKEEVGLEVKFIHVMKVVEFVFPPEFHERKHFIGLQSLCKVVGDTTPTIDNDEIQEARWFPLAEAANMKDVLSLTQKTIQKIITDKSL